jgi:hypothetical protein
MALFGALDPDPSVSLGFFSRSLGFIQSGEAYTPLDPRNRLLANPSSIRELSNGATLKAPKCCPQLQIASTNLF